MFKWHCFEITMVYPITESLSMVVQGADCIFLLIQFKVGIVIYLISNKLIKFVPIYSILIIGPLYLSLFSGNMKVYKYFAYHIIIYRYT